MTAAMQVANAVALARLRAAAELIALGCPAEMIHWHTPPNPLGNCGLLVAGHLAWEAHVEWDLSGEVPIATIKTWWCGGEYDWDLDARWEICVKAATARDWVPDETTRAFWRENTAPDRAWMGPRP